MKQCVSVGPTGTDGDSASGIRQFELAKENGPHPKGPDGDQACHNVTDERARSVVAALALVLKRWQTTPEPAEVRAVLLRLLLELEASK